MPTAGERELLDQRRDQILKLVTKGFFNELVNYGVVREEMIRVASHLLDHVLKQHEGAKAGPRRGPPPLTVASVIDRWKERALAGRGPGDLASPRARRLARRS